MSHLRPSIAFAMLLIIYFCVWALTFSVDEARRCNESYYKNAMRVVGKKQRFEYYPWRNYENLEREIKFLYIRRDTVKNICKSQLPAGVEEVVLSHVQLEYIEPGSFDDSIVEQVIIQGNNIKIITRGVFNGTKIKSLALSDNRIEHIQPNAFEGMPLLEAVALDDNAIKRWDPNWFTNAEILNEISFANNLLEELPEYTTRYMVSNYEKFSRYVLYGNINFDNNNIKYIHPFAFKNLEYFGAVSLSNNRLLELPEGVFKGFKFLFNLYLNTNNFICFSNNTVRSFKGVKRLYLGRNKLNKNCVDSLKEYFDDKNDLVYF